MNIKKIAELLSTGAQADIWYDALEYEDYAKADVIESTQDAMEASAKALPVLFDALRRIASMANLPAQDMPKVAREALAELGVDHA